MARIAIVAGDSDRQFAAEVRDRLRSASGFEAEVAGSLSGPADDSVVVLIWSASLEAAQAVEAQALVALWSESRLIVVRRDGASLPLGMRDLPSLPPDASTEIVCQHVSEALASHGDPAEVTDARGAFSRRDSSEDSKAPKALLSKPDDEVRFEAPIPKKKSSGVLIATAVFGILALGFGAYQFLTMEQRARQASLTAVLESATKAAAELQQAQGRQVDALREVERARAAEEAARKSVDPAKLQEAQGATRRAEAEANKQGELVKQREAAAAKARDDAKKAADAAKQAVAEKAKAAEKVEVAAAAPKVEAAKAAAPKVEAPKAEAPKAEAPRREPRSRSEREAARDAEAAAKALAAAGKGEVVQASAAPAAPGATAGAASKGTSESEVMYQQALAIENSGRAAESIRIYRRAARAGSGKAARRLGEIYDRGVPGVSRDYVESLQWYETARQLGEVIPVAGRGGGAPGAPSPAPKEPEAAKAASPPSAPAPSVPAKAAAPVAAATSPPPPLTVATPKPAPPIAAAQDGQWTVVWLIFVVVALLLCFALWQRARRKGVVPAAVPPPAEAAAGGSLLFVSYSHKDRSRIEPIVTLMQQMGRQVWMDRTAITGQAGWAGQIVRAIRGCRAVILMASPNSYASDQVVRELYLAMNHKKPIVPIEIEPAELPDELQYILAPFQHHRLDAGVAREVLGRALAAI